MPSNFDNDDPFEPSVAVQKGAVRRQEILTVSALTASVRDLLEHRFPISWITGEISNFTSARSGHWYFVLKDAASQVRVVMFRHRNQGLDWQPRDGVQVDVRATVTLYEARGDFQLNAESMRRAGLGALYEAYLRLRDKLNREGLFDPALKRPLPIYPRAIGVVSSLAAAALRDVLTTLARRNPTIPIIVYPSAVQGAGAAAELTQALGQAVRRAECDVIILTRGGGSIEDLWAFNDEGLARAIRASPIPIVSGVGHETDFTIADFVADMRAPTPTAAAEMVSPSRAALIARVVELTERIAVRTWRDLEARMQALDSLARRLVHPRERVRAQSANLHGLRTRLAQTTQHFLAAQRWRVIELARRSAASLPPISHLRLESAGLAERLRSGARADLERRRTDLVRLVQALHHLDPRGVLARGYGIVTASDGRVVTQADAVAPGATVSIELARGRLGARVDKVESIAS